MSTKNKDKMVNLVKWGMISCGLWTRPITNPILRKLNYVYATLSKINYWCFYFGLVVELIRLSVQKYPSTVVLPSFSVVVTASKISIIIVIYMKNNVFGLLDEVTKKEEDVWNDTDSRIHEMFNKKLKMGKLFSRSLWIVTGLTVSSVNVTGVIGNNRLVKYNEAYNVTIESHYLYKIYFPVNKLDHKTLMATISSVLSYGACIYNVTTNMIVVMLCIHAASHLVILQHRLRNYIPDDFTEDKMDEAIGKLTGLMFQHRYLIEFITYVNQCCKNIIMMEFVFTSIDVALTALNIIKLNLSDLGYMVFYFPMLVIQIYSISWSANEINTESQRVADAAYESKWYLLNKEGRRLTLTIIQRAQQRPLIMTIGPFGPMTLETFLMIMKAAYSYVSIMRKN